MFCNGELQSSVRISHGIENIGFHCCATPIIILPMFANFVDLRNPNELFCS